jgi:hypothetical protein
MKLYRSAALVPLAALAVLGSATIVVQAAYATGNPSVLNDNQASQFAEALTDTSEQPFTEVEPSIAVNPADSNNVVTAFQEARHNGGGDADNGFGTSLDGGHTWTYGDLPGNTVFSGNSQYGRASDASVAFGKDPRGYKGYAAYVNNLVFNDSTNPSGMSINVSLDGGITWAPPAFPEADNVEGLNDKNWIVADNGSGTGHHPGRVYNFWDKELAALVYSYCDPDVANPAVSGSLTGCEHTYNWSAFSPVDTCSVLPLGGSNCSTLGGILTPIEGIGAFPVVLNDGSVGVALLNETPSNCNPNNVTDQTCPGAALASMAWIAIPGAGSVAWPAPLPSSQDPVTISQFSSSGVSKQRAGGLPQAAVDPTTNDVFVVWEDNRFRTENNSNSNQNDPVVSVSAPAAPGQLPGFIWSAVTRIDSQEPTGDLIDRYNTTVAVGQDGIARFAYRERDENPAHGFNSSNGRGTPIDTYYQESRDAGVSFTAPLLVDTAQNTPDAGYGAYDTTNISIGGLFEGDYEQIAAGGTDESYVSRDEAYKGQSTSTPRDFSSSMSPSPGEWQQTWVSHLGPQQAVTPDSRFVPGLIMAGVVGAGAVAWLRRRRDRTVS